jgi:hypothetical protein
MLLKLYSLDFMFNEAFMAKEKTQSETFTAETAFTDFEFTCHYPEENPRGSEEDITNTLSYLGVFEGIKKQ